MNRQLLGQQGEELAAEYVLGLGWEVIARRWRCRQGEIDLVAVESRDSPTTVFVEVKARSGLGYGQPLEAITGQKLMRLRRLAHLWVVENRPHTAIRLDGIGVLLRPGWDPLITHVRGIS